MQASLHLQQRGTVASTETRRRAGCLSRQQPQRQSPAVMDLRVSQPLADKPCWGLAHPSHRRSAQQQSQWWAPAVALQAEDAPLEQPVTSKVRVVVAAACAAMLLAALHRVSFSVLAVPIQRQFGLSLPQMGLLQSALLMGYVVGQIPLGVAADRVGGARLLITCLFLWSFASLLFYRTPSAADPFTYMLAARAALGLGQSCIMPAVSSLSARWLPADERSKWTSTIYAFFSFGTVAGLAVTPFLAQQVGWAATFLVFGLVGMAYAALTIFTLPEEGPSLPHRHQQQQHQQPAAGIEAGADAEAEAGKGSSGAGARRLQQQHWRRLSGGAVAHLAMLCVTHSVISWGFFILQSWIPTFIHSLGMQDLEAVGVLSALPWLATALVSVAAGNFADNLRAKRHLPALTVRRLMQNIALLGAGLSLLPLAALPSAAVPTPLAVVLLTVAVAAQGFNYGGFHSYVQDVAPRDAGLVLGITNTCGTLVGIAGNVATGYLAGTRWGYQAVFALTVALHVLSALLWTAGACGEQLQLT